MPGLWVGKLTKYIGEKTGNICSTGWAKAQLRTFGLQPNYEPFGLQPNYSNKQ
ncbi:MAG: hypothetical protein MUC60_07790 [Oscillatoria sp. Prado101]|nr:hypothetical protein [Oscillatoria sp. Prado101]